MFKGKLTDGTGLCQDRLTQRIVALYEDGMRRFYTALKQRSYLCMEENPLRITGQPGEMFLERMALTVVVIRLS